MPFQGEFANKASHMDIVKNPDVEKFLENCQYLRDPSDEELKAIVDLFLTVGEIKEDHLPQYLVATDGSFYEASLNTRFPSTKVAYLKFGTILIKLSEYRALNHKATPLLDPFKVAALEENNRPVTLTLPSANVTLKGRDSVQESFRAELESWFSDNRTKIDDADEDSSLLSTLYLLASNRPDEMGTGDPTLIKLHKCPTCGHDPKEGILVKKGAQNKCPSQSCGKEIFATDCLRIWEEISEYQSNGTAIGRLMMVIEHILPVHYIRHLMKNDPTVLDSIIFFVDGPLAIFGNCAWLHRPIMQFYDETFRRLKEKNLGVPIILGLQKTGQISDFATLVSRELEPGKLLLISDDYRYKYIYAGRELAKNGFGDETYYGQDFIFKTPSGRIFVFGLPFPAPSKRPSEKFVRTKEETKSYSNLERALAALYHFESDMYENAVVPIALAHKYTSISLAPGGQVLDLFSRSIVNK